VCLLKLVKRTKTTEFSHLSFELFSEFNAVSPNETERRSLLMSFNTDLVQTGPPHIVCIFLRSYNWKDKLEDSGETSEPAINLQSHRVDSEEEV